MNRQIIGRIFEGLNDNNHQTWCEARRYIKEFFFFWPDGEDIHWAKEVWGAIELSGLFSMAGKDALEWTKANIFALSLLYAESATRLGVPTTNGYKDRELIQTIFGTNDKGEEHIIAVREAIRIHIADDFRHPENILRPLISSIIRGVCISWGGSLLESYLDIACSYERINDLTCFREDRLFNLWNGAEVSPWHLECLP